MVILLFTTIKLYIPNPFKHLKHSLRIHTKQAAGLRRLESNQDRQTRRQRVSYVDFCRTCLDELGPQRLPRHCRPR